MVETTPTVATIVEVVEKRKTKNNNNKTFNLSPHKIDFQTNFAVTVDSTIVIFNGENFRSGVKACSPRGDLKLEGEYWSEFGARVGALKYRRA